MNRASSLPAAVVPGAAVPAARAQSRLAKLYTELIDELTALNNEGKVLEHDLRQAINTAKMQQIIDRIHNDL